MQDLLALSRDGSDIILLKCTRDLSNRISSTFLETKVSTGLKWIGILGLPYCSGPLYTINGLFPQCLERNVLPEYGSDVWWLTVNYFFYLLEMC